MNMRWQLLWEVSSLQKEGKTQRDKGKSVYEKAKKFLHYSLSIFIYAKEIEWIGWK